MSFNASESAIVHGFQAFYYELLRQKEKALSSFFSTKSVDPSTEDESEENSSNEENVSRETSHAEGCVVEIQKKLLNVIENVSNVMHSKSRINPKFITDAKYIMAVLADEIFINMNWEGAKFWRYTLLEKQLFQTEIAGDKFFSMLDEIVADFSNEEMAFLYLMSLSLGFKGRYRDIENSEEHIGWYKDRLYSILNTKSARLYFPGRSHMVESCYESTYMESDDSQLPDSRFWSWCVLGVVFAYIVISYFVWAGITDDISEVLAKISEQTRQGPLL